MVGKGAKSQFMPPTRNQFSLNRAASRKQIPISCVENGATLEFKRGCGVSASQIIANIGIEIGEDALIGAGCLLCDSDMHEIPLGSGKHIALAPIRIGARAFIGARCIILKGVTVGEGAVIGAGSVVTRDVAPWVVATGNPAMEVRKILTKTANERI